MIENGEIKVSKKTLLHISEGIYRSYGSAIKEIVNNSFDAGATSVSIDTNPPLFDFISVQDNGSGMELNEFKRIVSGGIGDSKKSSHSNNLVGGRPIIGKLGIGILAIAQICRSFTIVSHHRKTKSAFKAKMVFNPSVDKIASESQLKESYPAGHWQLLEKPNYDESKAGVLIITDDLRPTFKASFKIPDKKKNESSAIFETYFKTTIENQFHPGGGGKKSIRELAPYHELIFELCNLLPIPYHGFSVIRSSAERNIKNEGFENALEFLGEKNETLKNFNFSVYLDNLKLYKCIKLPFPELRNGNPQECQAFYFSYDKKVRNRRLYFRGYFFAQEFAIYPREINGLQVRIKNVGIGLHDPSFLNYDQIDSPRDKWVSGEVYVEEGLESALNIDRDSFNENDEHFFVLRKEIHRHLREVLNYVKAKQSQRNKRNRQLKEGTNAERVSKHIVDLFSKYQVDVSFSDKDKFIQDRLKSKVYLPSSIISPALTKRREGFINILFEVIEFSNDRFNKDQSRIFIKDLAKIILS